MDLKNHILLGDCKKLIKSIPDETFDAIFTDPPFGIGYKYREGKEKTSNPEEYAAFLLPIVKECLRVAKPGACIAIYQTQVNFPYFWKWFGDQIHIYIASKKFVQMRKLSAINYGYDPVVLWYKIGANPLRPPKPKRNLDFFWSTVTIGESKKYGHPCPRPLQGTFELINSFIVPGGWVFDPFSGSGTTAYVCQQTGRQYTGIEIDPEYHRRSIIRLQGLTRNLFSKTKKSLIGA
jgi:DNA modification methylase